MYIVLRKIRGREKRGSSIVLWQIRERQKEKVVEHCKLCSGRLEKRG